MQVANSSSIWINASNAKKRQGGTKAHRAQGVAFKYVFSLILIAFICSLFYIWSRIQVVNIGYEINRSIALKEKLIEENKKLTLESATLKSPVRLEAMAHQSFQMDLPQKSQIVNQWLPAKEVKEAQVAEKTVKAIPAKPAKVASRSQDAKVAKVAKTTSTDKIKKENNLKTAKKAEAKPVLKVASVTNTASPKR